MFTAIIFIVILSVLIFVHELGHFTLARRNGIRVEEFGMGLPPRVWGVKRGDTLYSINLLPIGGFVKLYGEDATSPKELKDPRSFAAQTPLVRAKVLTAGVLANLALGVILLTLLFSIGVPIFMENPVVQEILAGSVAQEIGLMAGDQILSVDKNAVTSTTSLSEYISEHTGQLVTLEVLRGEEVLYIEAVPEDGKLGMVVTNFRMESFPPHEALVRGLDAAAVVTWGLLQGLGDFLTELFMEGEVADEIAGPVGIAQMTRQARELGMRFLLQFTGILSLNLALINILPFPALDGGRLLFVIFEAVTGRRADEHFERWVHTIGMALLLLLILLVTLQDLRRF